MLPHRALDRMINRRAEAWWERAISQSTVILVAEVNNEICWICDNGYEPRCRIIPQGEVYEIYMRPEYQGVGLGTGLFLGARRELQRRHLSGTVVWVLAENEQAIRFYENSGGRDNRRR